MEKSARSCKINKKLVIIIIIDFFDWLMIAYIALFSTLLSRLIALACGSTWVTSFIAHGFFLISIEVVYLQCWHGWCHMKLQLSQCKFCVHHTTMHHVTSPKAMLEWPCSDEPRPRTTNKQTKQRQTWGGCMRHWGIYYYFRCLWSSPVQSRMWQY